MIDNQVLRLRSYLGHLRSPEEARKRNRNNITTLPNHQVASETSAILAALGHISEVEKSIRPVVQPYVDQIRAEEARINRAAQLQ